MVESITSQMISQIKETFALFDKGTGVVTIEEMGVIFRALGQTPTQAELEIIQKDADPGKTGKINYSDFVAIFAKFQKEPVAEQEIMDSFEEIDEYKKGTITIKKLRYLMSNCGEALGEEEIQKMIHYANPDHDGNINYRDFVKIMMNK